MHRLTRKLNRALGYEQQLPEREPANLKQVLAACPSLEFMIDGIERSINRPKDKTDRKTYYSDNKKTHIVKTNLISEWGGKVVFLSDTYEGKKHDRKIAAEGGYHFPAGSTIWQDTGFQCFSPAGVNIKQPKKKLRKEALTVE